MAVGRLAAKGPAGEVWALVAQVVGGEIRTTAAGGRVEEVWALAAEAEREAGREAGMGRGMAEVAEGDLTRQAVVAGGLRGEAETEAVGSMALEASYCMRV